MNRRLIDYNPEGYGTEGEALLFGAIQRRPTVGSAEFAELELASAFLDTGNPTELGVLIDRLIRYGSIKAGNPIRDQLARALGTRLVPKASAIRGLLSTHEIILPGSQAELAAESAERIFGAELEGLSGEDQEFETARLFVRFALEAARVAARARPGHSPAVVAAFAERTAARRYAPGLIGTVKPNYPGFRLRRAVRRTFV
ncbi:hypothetical protein ACT4MK_12985 [Bradyrhizobium barranii]|jgi:hypothetical protein|uniref:hypothetical protein n=1 Tax=Bradyrhizobium TaxID=374 RepID=UPI003F20BF51